MNKESFVTRINYDDKLILANLYNKIQLAANTNQCIYTNEFYPPNVWRNIENISNDIKVGVHTFGIYEEAERRILAFSNDDIFYFPVTLVKIKNKSRFVKLEHKDFLGALLSIGIKREKYGDLIVKENCAYVASVEEVSGYIASNLKTVGSCPCEVEIFYDYSEAPQYMFEDIVAISTSLRLDCIVSSICGVSRNKAAEYISYGKVLIDYLIIKQKDKNVEYNSVLTIRGYGKYKIIKELGTTGKGRLKILFKKYI